MKRILVTGADGFIGSHLVETLVKKNYKVKALVYYNSFNSFGWLDKIDNKIKNKIEVISGDIRDINIIKSSLKNCQCVINLAALIGIPYSYFSPKSYYDTNVDGTLNILQAAKDLKIKKLFIHQPAKFMEHQNIYLSMRLIGLTHNLLMLLLRLLQIS